MNREGQSGTHWEVVQNGNQKRQRETATRKGNEKRQKKMEREARSGGRTGLRASGPALGNLGVVFRRVVRATEAPDWKLPG
ncbi:MAG: hypothetical protein ACLP2U_00785 [Syntrophobacteraceae bacterium]